MKMVKLALTLAGSFLVPAVALAVPASTPCPNLTGSDATYHAAATTTWCNIIVTIDNTGHASVAVVNTNPYDGVEDTYVGVINNDTGPLTSLGLTGSNIFAFDGDGIDTFGITGNGSDSTGYGGADAFFNITNASNGIVNFLNGGIAGNGGTGYFSLEEPPSVGSVGVTSVNPVPEPSTFMLLGTGALGVAASLRRRFVK